VGKFFGVLLLVLIDIPVLMLRGYVLTYLWRWFIQPFGAPPITIAWAIGLSMFVGFFTNWIARDAKLDRVLTGEGPAKWYEVSLGAMVQSVLLSLLAWGIGAIVASFM
jgi:hypothetical protein